MSLRETTIQSVQDLIDTYTQKPEGKKKRAEVSHEGFEQLPKDTRKVIEAVINEVYRGDFEIIRKAFIEKLEFFLRIIANALEEDGCTDTELQAKISTTRRQIADVVNEVEVSDEDMKWLKRIGFLPIDIFELTAKLDISSVISELRENIDEYRLILGDEKYIVKILKMYEGLDKLRRLRSFCKNYDREVVTFNGYHLAQIVLGAGWEEKLKYFEDPVKLKRLQDAGFNGSHLAEVVRNAGWEEKLKYFEDPMKLKRLQDAGFNGYHLAQIVRNAGWEEKLKYFEDPMKLKRLQDAGFNGYHLAQIVIGAGWEEKLKVALHKDCLALLTKGSLTHDQLAKLLQQKDWKNLLRNLGVNW